MSQQLNFLAIISGEHRKDAMGCAGHPIVKTRTRMRWPHGLCVQPHADARRA
ncbi:hypothetical protein K3555_16320 [Leisingera sp. M527]|uniref:hypothetical protein n=1 Tax=unclassified Leisingera TaxID=2614906 RepID=UPI0021A6FDED|nr:MULTISPECIES: hypothetical protein [unclassified Leisingera]UWQ35108.1 hypothetical protein K3555_16320 [Leisingera sp. M527]UWQ74076.1 hypothetical protein K3724_16295 [Leisingera sp. M658]